MIISIANHKGGVGKTTTVASLGAALASAGKRVLMVDLDAQSNLTTSLLCQEQQRTIYDALKERNGLPIVNVSAGLDIVPASLDLAGIELELAGVFSREFILSDLLKDVANDYDFVLLDCPPSLGLITINALVASSKVIIPLTAEALPFKGLRMLENIIGMIMGRLNPSLQLGGIVITRWGRRKLNKIVEEGLTEVYGPILFSTRIRENIAIAEAPLTSKNIFDYAPGCNGAIDYQSLATEFINRFA